jgi:ketosteroid isomerase-like protein
MKRILCITAMLTVALTISLRPTTAIAQKPSDSDQAALKELIKEWADAAVHADLQKLEKFADDNFAGNAGGISFNKKMLIAAIKSGQMKVASWDCNNDDVKVAIRGNSAQVTGRCTLSNATYMGKDFSGGWDFVDRFVKQRDGSWRAVSSQAKRFKQ